MAPGGGAIGTRLGAAELARAIVQVLPAWIVARVVVVTALAFAHAAVGSIRPDNPEAARRVHDGLLGWDAGWYQAIAAHGYGSAGKESLRFFPLFPLLGRAVGIVPGIGIGPALILVGNLSALVAMAALLVLVRRDFGDAGLARRSVWLLALAPSAYSLVLAYSDATLLLCSVVTFLGARTQRWWLAAMAGLAAGFARPVGIILLVPVAVELWARRRDRVGAVQWSARLAALVAPVVGAGAYLVWVGRHFGDSWLPLTVQQQSGHRGHLSLPFVAMWHDLGTAMHGHHIGSALHVPWVVGSVILLVVAWRRLPRSYALFAASVLVVSASSTNLDSFERYALGAFPLVIAGSMFTSNRRVEVAVLAVSGLVMAGYAALSFLGLVVP